MKAHDGVEALGLTLRTANEVDLYGTLLGRIGTFERWVVGRFECPGFA